MFPFPEPSLVCICIEWLRQAFCSLELRVQFFLLVSCADPSLLTVNKEKNQTDQRASLRVDTTETQQTGQSITALIAWKKEEWRKEAADVPTLRSGTSLFSQTNTGTVSRTTSGRLPRDGAERMWVFPSTTMPC